MTITLDNLTLNQKAHQIVQLGGDLALRLKQNYWYVNHTEIYVTGITPELIQAHSRGETPEVAIESWWQQYVVDLPTDAYLIAKRRNPNHLYRWDEFNNQWLCKQ